ncbi:MAG: hypothetical protein MJ208_01665 [Bacilli bacterium]|nr:hypothetical protein [Bacilli bacterium]
MSKFKMDAEKVAASIYDGDFSKLHGKFFEMCDNTNMGKKYTLNQLGLKIDQISEDLAKLTKYVTDGFKRIDTRLDYIVQANSLKDLPKNK